MKNVYLFFLWVSVFQTNFSFASSPKVDVLNISKLIQSADLNCFLTTDKICAKKIKQLLDCRNSTHCIINLSKETSYHETKCSVCLSVIKPVDSVMFNCSHSYHFECFLRSWKQIISKSSTVSGFACIDPDCDGQTNLGGWEKYALDEETMIQIFRQDIFPLITSLRIYQSCGQGAMITNHIPLNEFGLTGECSKCLKKSCFNCGNSPHAKSICNPENTQKTIEFLQQLVIEAKSSGSFGYCPHCSKATIHYDGCENMRCISTDSSNSSANQGCGKTFQWHERKTVSETLKKLDPEWWHKNQNEIAVAERQQNFATQDPLPPTPAYYHTVYENRHPQRMQVELDQIDATRLKQTLSILTTSSSLAFGSVFIHSACSSKHGLFNVSKILGLSLGVPMVALSGAGYLTMIAKDSKIVLQTSFISLGVPMILWGITFSQWNGSMALEPNGLLIACLGPYFIVLNAILFLTSDV